MHINSLNRLLLKLFIDGDQFESMSDISDKGQHRDKICLVEELEKQALLAWGFDAWGQLLQSGQSELVWRRRISVGFIGDIKGRTDSDLADYMMVMESAGCTPASLATTIGPL